MTRLFVVVDGGSVTKVASDEPEALADLEVVVVDHDMDGVEPRYLARVTPGIGHLGRASAEVIEIQTLDFSLQMPSRKTG